MSNQEVNKMTFKDKHFKQAFGPLLLSAFMAVPMGCSEGHKTEEAEKQQTGLMDSTPLRSEDKYGFGVTLHHVTIPVYDRNGERKKDQGILTRGLMETAYNPDTSRTYVRKAYVNDSSTPSYVKVDRNNAIFTDQGFCGLFLDGSSVVVIDDANLDKFIGYKTSRVPASFPFKKNENSGAPKSSSPRDSVANNDSNTVFATHGADSINADSSHYRTDTIFGRKNINLSADTVAQLRQNVNE